MLRTIRKYAMVALSIVGSATLLFSCGKAPEATVYDYETLMTESSENRTVTMMENGKRSYIFTTPLIEGYSLAKNPYQEFRRGVKITTFTSDTIPLIDAILTANYAIYYENQKLWEAKGNVVINKYNRKGQDTTVTGITEVYTQQLFWNATTEKIYSNVDTKVLQPDGWHFGVGFDADEDLKNIHFRKYSSEVEFEMREQQRRERDSLTTEDGAEVDDRATSSRQGNMRPANSARPSSNSRGEANMSRSPQNRVQQQQKAGGKLVSPSGDAQRPTPQRPTQQRPTTQRPTTQRPTPESGVQRPQQGNKAVPARGAASSALGSKEIQAGGAMALSAKDSRQNEKL